MDALAFLKKSNTATREPVVVLAGDEDFLKRLCQEAVIGQLLGDADAGFAVSTFAGDSVDFSTVRNELDTLPFLAPARVVVVEQADSFVSNYREQLEKMLLNPPKLGVLILSVKTFPESTRLAKQLPAEAKLVCKSPSTAALIDWCKSRAKKKHGKSLSAEAAGLLVELSGTSMGLLEQELDKLAVAVGSGTTIEPDGVLALVAKTREGNVFRIMDAIGEGKAAEALGVLGELLDQGEDPYAILGALTAQLRKLAGVNRQLAKGMALGPALDAAGVPKWPAARQSTERQLRHIGRQRLDQLTDWIIQINMGFRGESPLPHRTQLERLLVNLAKPRQPAR